jgi:hypothetical protein
MAIFLNSQALVELVSPLRKFKSPVWVFIAFAV